MQKICPSEIVLLTGAGFTETFGGYLGSEMWARIFNQPNIQKYPKIRKALLSDLNFESVYSRVVESSRYTRQEKQSFTAALRNAYKSMHDSILSENNDLIMKATGASKAVISQFVGSTARNGFFFTLNQDQFIERWFEDVNRSVISMPGIKPGIRWFYPTSGPWIDSTVELPDKTDVNQIVSKFYNSNDAKLIYIKLHGSYGWRSADRQVRGDLMIIGRSKSDLIAKEPLLQWYFSLFQKVLSRAKKLVVIGYGFADKHINEAILKNASLNLFVICPLEPEVFKSKLVTHGQSGRKLWNKMANYYQGKITQLYDAAPQELTRDGQNYFENIKGAR